MTSRPYVFTARPRLRCPANHTMPQTFTIPEFGFVRCQHWLPTQRQDCGKWVFVYQVRGGLFLVAPVSLEEQRELGKLATPAEVLIALGLGWQDAS